MQFPLMGWEKMFSWGLREESLAQKGVDPHAQASPTPRPAQFLRLRPQGSW